MKIKLLTFGIAKEIINNNEITFEKGQETSIHQLKNLLIDKYPKFADLKYLKFAVNESYVEDNFTINEKDEVAIIPPVSGG